MRLKANIQQELLSNMSFRKALADERKTDTPNATKLIRTNSELLTTIPVVELIKTHTGKTELKEIFDFSIPKNNHSPQTKISAKV